MRNREQLRQMMDGLSEEQLRGVLQYLGVDPEPETVVTTARTEMHPALAHRAAAAHVGGGSHRTDFFYVQIFALLTAVTIVEVFWTAIGNDPLRVTGLIVYSFIKFALVIMFFMHLKGDRPVFSWLFVVPLFIASAVAVSLTGLFTNF